MSQSDTLQIEVLKITVGPDRAPMVGPSSSVQIGKYDKLDTLFRKAYDQLQITIPFEELEWLQFLLGDPIPGQTDQDGSGPVHLPATLKNDQTPESLHWQDGTKVYAKDKKVKVNYTESPQARRI